MIKAVFMVICLMHLANARIVQRQIISNETWDLLDRDTGSYCDLKIKSQQLSCNGYFIYFIIT